ncbi:MAG TPA: formyltransferase family protein [Blastocatellia bacterium]|nr:formyltransferase family protein [Blastocatellia bacterium]
MIDKKLRVIVLTHGGSEKAIEHLLALNNIEMRGIFIETETEPRRSLREKVRRSLRYDGYRATAGKLLGKAARALAHKLARSAREDAAAPGRYERLCEIAQAGGVPVQFVASYHSPQAAESMRAAAADLGVVLGTNILKESVFNIPRLGSINLHQGLAPFYRGGPPVFWELFNGESEVGLTVHFVASKVDTGEIVLQESVPLAYDYSYGLDFEAFIEDYRRQLADRSASLVAEAVRQISEGSYVTRPQDTSLGKRYRLPVKGEKDELRRRLSKRRAGARLFRERASAEN